MVEILFEQVQEGVEMTYDGKSYFPKWAYVESTGPGESDAKAHFFSDRSNAELWAQSQNKSYAFAD